MSTQKTLRVSLKYFASIRETIGHSSEQRTTAAATLFALRTELIALGGGYAQALSRDRAVRLALNQVMSDESALLQDGAEVAFFPPVTGG